MEDTDEKKPEATFIDLTCEIEESEPLVWRADPGSSAVYELTLGQGVQAAIWGRPLGNWFLNCPAINLKAHPLPVQPEDVHDPEAVKRVAERYLMERFQLHLSALIIPLQRLLKTCGAEEATLISGESANEPSESDPIGTQS